MIFAEGNGQLDYVQREVYAGSERIEQFTDRSNSGYERTLYVHEDVQGNTRYYTKTNGNSFAELTYDAWGMPVSPNKLLNNDHGNYVYATYTGHIFDTMLDIYFAEARFYNAQTRTWLDMDPIKDGGNWYQYCFSNPLRYWDPTGLVPVAAAQQNGFSQYGGCQGIPYAARWQDPTEQLYIYSSWTANRILQSILKIIGNGLVSSGNWLEQLGGNLRNNSLLFGLTSGLSAGAGAAAMGGAAGVAVTTGTGAVIAIPGGVIVVGIAIGGTIVVGLATEGTGIVAENLGQFLGKEGRILQMKNDSSSNVNNSHLSNQEANNIKNQILEGQDVEFKTKEEAVDFIKRKFSDFNQETAGNRSSQGWHFDKHLIDQSEEAIEHINIYSKKLKFRVHITWRD